MPTTPRKARVLLKQKKATLVHRTPFTIRLMYATGEATQPITLGVDSGYAHVGLSAVSETEEVFAADVALRTNLVKLNSERRTYRRARRSRKTWYRQPRFLNRKKPEGWLAPSIQHKLDSHMKLIAYVKTLLPISSLVIEVATFDIQKIKNPTIEGIGYQQGDQYGFANTREYVLSRDGHRCRLCKGKRKDPSLNVHHLVSRQVGGDRPDNLITACETCHDEHHVQRTTLTIRSTPGFRGETFMTSVRWRLVDATGAEATYGYLTKLGRKATGLPKSHVNDAFVIAGGANQSRTRPLAMRQIRKCNRKLFRGAHSHLRNTAPREIYGFRCYDKVTWHGVEAFVFGRRTRGRFNLRKIDGTVIHTDAPVRELRLLARAKPFLRAYRPGDHPANTSLEGAAPPPAEADSARRKDRQSE